MIPPPFAYERARSVEHAIRLLADHGDEASVLAGGHSLLPLMKLRLARPSVLVDVSGLQELSYVRERDGRVEIGALTRLHDVATNPVLQQRAPLVAEAAGEIGDPQVRHRGTFGGGLAYADPAGDPPTVAVALDAELVARGPDGSRTIPAGEFFVAPFESALRPDELLVAVRVPPFPPGAGFRYLKFRRRALDWAIVGVACVVEVGAGTIRRARIALTNMGSTPVRATSVEEALAESKATPATIAAAAGYAPDGTSPHSDDAASAEYRRELSRVLVRRAIERCIARATTVPLAERTQADAPGPR